MDAGRELDTLIAEKVMGLAPFHPEQSSPGFLMVIEPGESGRELPHYSTEISAAWNVVTAMRPRGHWMMLSEGRPSVGSPDYGKAETTFVARIGSGYAEAVSASHAICLAALSAVGE